MDQERLEIVGGGAVDNAEGVGTRWECRPGGTSDGGSKDVEKLTYKRQGNRTRVGMVRLKV